MEHKSIPMKPKMILFDVGRTLLDYAEIDTYKGVKALMPYIVENPRNLTAEEIDQYTNKVFSLFDECRKALFEVPEQTILALVYDLLGLKFSISIADIERIIWNHDSVNIPVPHVKELIDGLNERNIRTAVISNLDFSGYLLRESLDALYPGNRFEFVIASSDYGIRKPHSFIFEAALTKTGLESKDIWYVGDKVSVDVNGSKAIGMTPVLFKHFRNTYPELPDDLIVIGDMLDLLKLITS